MSMSPAHVLARWLASDFPALGSDAGVKVARESVSGRPAGTLMLLQMLKSTSLAADWR